MTTLVWYRNDLRVNGHSPLATALASGQAVRAVYLLCSDQWLNHGVAPIRQAYVLQSLLELNQHLADLGVPLDVINCDRFERVPEELFDYCQYHQITALYCNREHPLNERRRDKAVRAKLANLSITLQGFDDGELVSPRLLRTQAGTPYTVFTPYRRRWQELLYQQPPSWPTLPLSSKAIAPNLQPLVDQALGVLNVSPTLLRDWPAGESHARQQLSDFIATDLAGYKQRRDFPATKGTSLLSVALSAGTLSAREAYRAAIAEPPSEGASTWVSELAWRDFYRQIMANFPRLAKGEPFRSEGNYLRWQNNETKFQAWCEGQTGYPLVDAAMRQLVETGWMHNRLRMLTAMFLSKHLQIDWRRGEAFFMQHLIDGDFAANNGGWQWSASVGTDAVPYFRVFSPMRQSERFDPDGEFIHRFVPELRGLSGKTLHHPWKHPNKAAGYVAPIVPHVGVKQRVEQLFRQAKEQWKQLQ